MLYAGCGALVRLGSASNIVWPCRYDVELFQKIEALTRKKMELFQAEQVGRQQRLWLLTCPPLANTVRPSRGSDGPRCHGDGTPSPASKVGPWKWYTWKCGHQPCSQDAVLMMLERVGDSQRIATMQMRETDKRRKGGKRKGGGGNDDDRDGDDGQMCVTVMLRHCRPVCRDFHTIADWSAVHMSCPTECQRWRAGSRGSTASDNGNRGHPYHCRRDFARFDNYPS